MYVRIVLAACIVSFHAAPALAQTAACKSTASGDLRFHQLDSRIFGNTRTLRVWLPPGYGLAANSTRRYPVLYLLDGQNLFDACLSEVSHQEWRVDETMERLVGEKRIPQMIVVGIDHAGARRAHEFLPYKDYPNNPDMEDPAGKRFPDFLAGEAMPLVNQRYRTLTGHANTGIGGSSYGGVAALYALLARPGAFGYGLIESPSLAIGMGQLVRDTHPLIALPRKVFVAFGGKETDDPVIAARVIELFRIVEGNFHAAGYDDANFRFRLDRQARHDEVAWAARFPEAMQFLFGEWKAPP